MGTITKVYSEQIYLFNTPLYKYKLFVETTTQEEKIPLFEYYPDEISFTKEELIGKTIAEAQTLRHEKDVAYLKTP